MKKIVGLLLMIPLVCLLMVSCNKKEYKIGIVQIVEHPSLNTIRDSVKEQLNELGYTDENTDFKMESAAGDTTIASQICQEFVSSDVDVIVAIATPTALAAVNACRNTDIPVIFAAVSDPVQAGLVDSLENPGSKCTGTSDELQIDEIMALAKEFDQDLNKLGVLYNNSEQNSVSNIERVKQWAAQNNIEIVDVTGTTANELALACDQLIAQNVDAVFAPNDNTVAIDGTMQALSEKLKNSSIPFYVGADSMVGQGGFATKGINYVQLGRETAVMADEVIKGKNIKEISVKVYKDDLKVYINQSYLEALGLSVPSTISNDLIEYI